MYDLLDIIHTRLSGMDQLISGWMNSNQLIKATLLDEIKTIKKDINNYHNKYVICKAWQAGICKFGTRCLFLHPTFISNLKILN